MGGKTVTWNSSDTGAVEFGSISSTTDSSGRATVNVKHVSSIGTSVELTGTVDGIKSAEVTLNLLN